MSDLWAIRVKEVGARRAAEKGSAMSWSMLALMIYTVVQIGRPQELLPGLSHLRLALLTAGLTAAAALAEGRLSNLTAIFRTIEMRCTLSILALGVISAPMGVWPGGSYSFIGDQYLKVICYFVLLQLIVRSLADVRRLIWAMVLSSLTLGVAAYLFSAGILQGSEIRGQIVLESGLERVTVSETYSANELALILACAVPFVVVLSRRQSLIGRLVQFACLGLIAVVIVQTGSRAGFVSLGLVGVLMPIRFKWLRWNGKMAALVVAAGLMGSMASSAYWERLGTMVNPTTHYEETYSGRSEIWARGLSLVLSRPIFGVGIGNFGTADETINGQRGGRSAHNSFVEIWAELGVAGLIALCVLLWSSLMLARRLARLHQNQQLGALATASEISLISFIVGNFVLSMQYSQVLYFLVGVPLVCGRVAAAREASVVSRRNRR
jgi:O-antigen ligase